MFNIKGIFRKTKRETDYKKFKINGLYQDKLYDTPTNTGYGIGQKVKISTKINESFYSDLNGKIIGSSFDIGRSGDYVYRYIVLVDVSNISDFEDNCIVIDSYNTDSFIYLWDKDVNPRNLLAQFMSQKDCILKYCKNSCIYESCQSDCPLKFLKIQYDNDK